MWRHIILSGVLAGTLAGRAGAQTPLLLMFEDMKSRFAVSQAFKGATTRLGRQKCQDVLSEFTDETGRSLSAKLAAAESTPLQAFNALRFVDDRRAPQCRYTVGARLAFTQTGSPLIRVCGQHFTEWFTRHPETTEIILLHEFLHSLGLGENPPTSEAITERVARRCGGAGAAGQSTEPTQPIASESRLRFTTARITQLAHDGAARSATFRRLLHGIEQTDGLVYLSRGRVRRE
jgi:hypothetical protein